MPQPPTRLYPSGQPAPVKGIYEVIGVDIAAAGSKRESPVRAFQTGQILPTYEGWEVCWRIREAEGVLHRNARNN